jgi:hypothetical protein
MKEVLSHYRNKLINTSQRNKSVFLPKTSTGHSFDLHRVDFLENKSSFSILESILSMEKTGLARLSDARNAENNLVATELKKLQRNAQFGLEETGSKNLYLAWPFIQGKTTKGTLLRSPLLLFSVELKVEQNRWVLSPEAPPFFNKSLFYAIANDDSLQVEDHFLEEDFEAYPADSVEFRTRLYNLLKENLIDIDFGADTFRNVLLPYVPISKDDFRLINSTGRYKVQNQAVLGIFSMSDGYTMQDFDLMVQSGEMLARFENLLSNPSKAYEYNLLTPYPCDAWQEAALTQALQGKSLVVEGPPGSGKSQLICNLILNLIYENKKVLLVSQKSQALEVIFKKLSADGFEDKLSFLHDFRKEQKQLYAKLLSQIESNDYVTKNSDFETEIESELKDTVHEINSICSEFEAMRDALFDKKKFGISAHELYHKIRSHQPEINLDDAKEYLNISNKFEVEKRLKIALVYRNKFTRSGHPFAKRVSFSNFSRFDLDKIKNEIDRTDHLKQKLDEFYQKMIPNDLNYRVNVSEIDFIISQKEKLDRIGELISDIEVFEIFKAILNLKSNQNQFRKDFELLIQFLSDPLIESSSLDEILQLQSKISEAIKKQQNLLTGLSWRFFSKNTVYINRFLIRQNLTKEKRPLQKLLNQIDNRLNFEHIHRGISNLSWTLGFPKGYEAQPYLLWYEKVERAFEAKELFISLKHITHLFEMEGAESSLIIRKLDRIYVLAQEIRIIFNQICKYLSLEQVEILLENPQLKETYFQALKSDFDDLVYFDKFWEDLPNWQKRLYEACFELEIHDYEKLRDILEQNIFRYFIKVLEYESPELSLVSTEKFSLLQENLRHSIEKSIELSQKLVKKKLSVTCDLPNPSKKELVYQLQKKRNLQPIRKLIEQFGEYILELSPCWLASPDTVSAIFPIDFMFDVVIFDEASQCFAEKGLPCFFRAKQVMVCGDQKQLSPSNFYQTADTEEQHEQGISILEFSHRYFNSVLLRGHYRSENPMMIEFSNRFFYGGRLRFLEHYQEYLAQKFPITFYNVKGIWQNQTNEIEAQKVIEIVRDLYQKGIYSIAVVSFNFAQQQLIESLAEELPEVPTPLLIRNIENIQGDERDFVILTLAYSKDPNGKLNNFFGALSQAGGENRLNVAITRARKHIFLVSSLEYSDFEVDGLKNEGPKLLREYLRFARFGLQALESEPEFQATELAIWDSLDCDKEFRKGIGVATQQGLLCSDDPQYLRSANVKDLFGYLPLELERKGWAFRRFYARERWILQEGFEREIKKFASLGN